MPAVCILDEFEIKRNQKFLKLAESLKPKIYKEIIRPQRIVKIKKNDSQEVTVEALGNMSHLPDYRLSKGDSVCLDFGNHYVGYITLRLAYCGSHQDAPAYLKLKFGEVPGEIVDSSQEYNGWISKGWIQEEYIHVDVLPAEIRMPRRYAFRYLQIAAIDTSLKFQVEIEEVSMECVTSAGTADIQPLETGDEMLDQIDEISIYTLKECMQDVFEDGPKRDRRMWLGDFRLQARANYVTFKNYDIVKRCLYLFSGLTFNEDKVSACLFTEPVPEPDDTYLFDYALFLVPTLLDYYDETGDRDTLCDIYPIAMKQIDNSIKELDEEFVVKDKGSSFWCFIDWGEGLNKQAGAQAILIYCMRYGIRLAQCMEDYGREQELKEKMICCKKAAIKRFWDQEENMFTSGEEKQISWATQIWMILAEVFEQEKNRELIQKTILVNPRIRMVTPYMYHHYIDALIKCGEEQQALDEMKRYWGEMIRDGADTFWELYNPYNKSESPYGSSMVNSYCHAWSCTPTYFLRKFFKKRQLNLADDE